MIYTENPIVAWTFEPVDGDRYRICAGTAGYLRLVQGRPGLSDKSDENTVFLVIRNDNDSSFEVMAEIDDVPTYLGINTTKENPDFSEKDDPNSPNFKWRMFTPIETPDDWKEKVINDCLPNLQIILERTIPIQEQYEIKSYSDLKRFILSITKHIQQFESIHNYAKRFEGDLKNAANLSSQLASLESQLMVSPNGTSVLADIERCLKQAPNTTFYPAFSSIETALSFINTDESSALYTAASFIWFMLNRHIDPAWPQHSVFVGQLKAARYCGMIGEDDFHSDFESIQEYRQEMLTTVTEAKEEIKGHKATAENVLNEHNKTIKALADRLVELKDAREKELDELEKLFNKKLAVEAPSEYWRKTAFWKGAATFVFALFSGVLTAHILITLNDYLGRAIGTEYQHIEFTAGFVRVGIIQALILSLMIYVLRILIKATMSNYHLYADARERSRLIESYLSLIRKDPKFLDEKAKEAIIAAIFARSDTGLLKDDGHPLMPVAQALKLDK